MYKIIYRIEILKEYLSGVMAEYFQYMKDNKVPDLIEKNYNRLKEIYSIIILVNDMHTLDEFESEIKEYKKALNYYADDVTDNQKTNH